MAKSFVKTESERKQTNKQTHGDLSSPWSAHSMHDALARAHVYTLSLSLIFLTHFFPFETIEYLRVFNFLTNKLVSLSYHSKLLNYPGQILVYSFFLYMSMNEFMNECNW